MKLKSINAENAQDTAVCVVGGGFGAMTSGAVNAVTPANFRLVGKILHVVGGVALAASAKGKDTASQFVKGFGIGLAVKPAYDLGTEQLRKVIPVNAEKNDFVENLKAGFVGLKGMRAKRLPTQLLAEFQPSNDTFDFSNENAKETKFKLNF